MDFEAQLDSLLKSANGVFENIRWSTMSGSMLTLGTMTDDHVANSRYYHKHLAEVARVAPELRVDVNQCLVNMRLMDMIIVRRQHAKEWSIDAYDFRLN